MKTIRFHAAVDLQAASGQKPRRFSILAYTGGTLSVSGFDLPVVVDLSGLQANGAVPILLDHRDETETTIGQVDGVTNDGRRLVLTGTVTGQSPAVVNVLAQHDNGHKWQASIGALLTNVQEIAAGQVVTANGQTFRGPIYLARSAVLRETSVLPMGADAQTSVNLAAKAKLAKGSTMSFEQWCEGMGIDPAKLTEEGRAILNKEFDAKQNSAAGENGEVTASAVLDLRAQASTESRRIAAVHALTVGHPAICATAIEQGWTTEKTELHVLKARQRGNAPDNRVTHSGGDMMNDQTEDKVLCASLLLRCNEPLAVKAYGERSCEVARHRRITNLVDLAGAALRAAGRSPESYGGRDQMLRAAFTTTSLPTILSDTVGRTLTTAYEETTSEWKKFCHVASADDFRTQTGIRPSAMPNLSELADGGSIRHGTIGEENTFSWAVKTYAEMLSITRKTIIDDDLGFIAQLSPMLGSAAGRTLLDLIWSTIMGGQTANYFSVGNANLLTSSSALAVGSLGVAVAAMKSQTDSQGFNVATAPVVLAVPPGLELTARNLLASPQLFGTTAETTGLPVGNPVQNIVPNLIVEPRLANARFSFHPSHRSGSTVAALRQLPVFATICPETGHRPRAVRESPANGEQCVFVSDISPKRCLGRISR